METREGICIALITTILAICYFSPNYKDCFGNIFYSGPQRSLNQKSLQAGFPFYNEQKLEQSRENGTRDASIRNYDGSIANGYQPFIIRPPDSTGYKKQTPDGKACSWPCYAGSKHQQWCNEENSIDYYAMRPLVRPKTYNEWLINMFKHIIVPGNSVSNILDSKLVPKMFCSNGTPFNVVDEKKVVMKWLMQRIAVAVTEIPQLQKNGSWKNEEFHHTDSEMYAFTTDNNKGSVYKLVFNLYNPLRSTATLVEAVVISPDNKGYTLVKMGFVSKGEWDVTNPKTPGVMQGYNLPESNGKLVIDLNSPGLPSSSLMDWNYGNTLNVQEFNEYGYYENGKNVDVKGGVPESLKAAISKHEGQMLLPCGVTRFTGVDPETNKEIKNTGVAKVVLNNPSLIYKNGSPSPVYN